MTKKRTCGDCSLCCTLLPVRSMAKPANRNCIHQASSVLHTHKGCAVYGTDKMPHDCRLWNCRWIVNADTDDMPRPDRCHYVIDVVPDFITLGESADADTKLPVIQIWCDPKYPDAHRDPALRKYLERRAREGFAALVRYSASEGFALFAPIFDADRSGQWHELQSNQGNERTHSAQQIVDVLERSAAGQVRS